MKPFYKIIAHILNFFLKKFGGIEYFLYLCTVFKINTAPKILKKRELGKFMNLKSYNRSPVRRLEEEVGNLTLRIIETWNGSPERRANWKLGWLLGKTGWQAGKTAIFCEMFNHEGAVVKVAPSIKRD